MKEIKRQKLTQSDNILRKNSNWKIKSRANTDPRRLVQEKLSSMTNNRCAFCGALIKNDITIGEIEHFYPKEKYNKLKDAWCNLFWSCKRCNSAKGEKFLLSEHIKPLKPDRENNKFGEKYEFKKWFRFDFDTGKIMPLKANPDWKRAEWTIELFKLNKVDKTTARKANLESFKEEIINCNARKETKRPILKKALISETYDYAFYISEWKRLEFLKSKVNTSLTINNK